jgi:type VI secretion system secreted protein VgrG
MVAIPRVGQEVVVEFIEGDPDRPLVTGCIYNGEQTQHYPLPDEKTKSYWKTNSSPGGDGYNELMFEDKAGEEKVFLHAQKDMDLRTLNETKQISLANHHQVVGTEDGKSNAGDYNQLFWRDNNVIVKRDEIKHVEGNQMVMVGNGGVVDIVIEKKEAKKIGQEGKHLIVEGDSNSDIGGSWSVNVGGSQQLKAGGDIAIEAGAAGQVHIKAATIIIEATQQISLKAGANFIDLGPAGISIQGTMVNINSGGAPGNGKGCSPAEPDEAVEAEPAEAAAAWDSSSGQKSRP